MNNAIVVSNLHVSYYGKEVLQNIGFTISEGKSVGIIGPNGAGKSTLLKALLNLIPKDKGEITILGSELKEVRKRIAYVPQRSTIDWDFPITVKDTVLIGTYPTIGLLRRPGRLEKELALKCLEKVDMTEFQNRQIGELSGGQQQRVFLARALAQQADLFLLDEPFVGIDATSEEMIVKILKELRDVGKTIIVVHHDLNKAEKYFDELLLLNKELIAKGSVKEVFTPKTIASAYGGQLSFLDEVMAK
ncbi:metal ABC transporter ATP-binding protein [Sporosarcina sp. JAI121]|uniref:metal ABC transporter ATP-binding protein n=1 Tax=Sporosarcina sp. JAI121 TaxID=2723064 RepID=UPI0015C7D166|nr:metal ABC transporter ATP-binding protein [Sporosarcina sp. JAI121]NYF25255.1 iron/zinc/copper transport system ATP-binding protein [Sporosarcina sp. JAI121]